jgi:nucleoside-diphosphate-sugar epimerase
MKVLITGAAGFVGSVLAKRLILDSQALNKPVTELILVDIQASEGSADPNFGSHSPSVNWCTGDLADSQFIDRLAAQTPDVVFHIASMPGGAAERDPGMGLAVNLHGTARLFEQLTQASNIPVVVFTSTVAVYGGSLPSVVDDSTPLKPMTSYATHKLMTEYLLADLSRRGKLDGRSVRLPGIVARPPQAGGHVSAFMSDIIHRLATGETYTCPVSATATCWWMSVSRCVDNLLHAACLTPSQIDSMATVNPAAARTWQLPVLRFSIGELVDTLATLYGTDRSSLVTYAPVDAVQAQFGNLPMLLTPAARALGLKDDGDIESLVRRALHPH